MPTPRYRFEVYDAMTDVTETFTTTKELRSLAAARQFAAEWAQAKHVKVTLILPNRRPDQTFNPIAEAL